MLDAQWQNPARPADVNNDGIAVPLDALLVLNRIAGAGAGTLPQRTNPLDRYYDVSGDGQLTPLDALLVLNEISRGHSTGHYINGRVEGESEVAPAGFISMPLASLSGQSGELVDLSTSITIGSREFNEMGVFVVDTADGMMGNLSPSSPGYADAVFASGHRHVLYSRRDILRDSRDVTLPANSQVHVYVLQGFSDDGDPAKHIRVREREAGSMRIGWEEQAVVSPWPMVGDRYFDDVIVDVQVGSPYAGTTGPVLNFIPNQTVAELTELQVQAIAVDAELPNDVLTFSLDAAPPGVSLNALSGLLTWTPTEAQGPGTYPITIRVTDQAGNFDTRSFQVTVLEVNLPPVLEPIPDRSVRPTDVISINAVAADPDIPANRLMFSLDVGAPDGALIDPLSGQFQWTAPDVATSTAFPITVRVTDDGSPRLSATQSFTITVNPLVDCAFDDQLTGWTVFESGGSIAGRGTVVAGNCTATITEGDSFVVGLERSFTIPETPTAIQFTYDNLAFDTTDPNFIKDAFEVALVDRDGNALVAPFVSGRDAFFNITEGMQATSGQGIQVDGNTITIGLNGIPVGTEGKIVFRLANNDADEATSVRITDFEFVASSLPSALPNGIVRAESENGTPTIAGQSQPNGLSQLFAPGPSNNAPLPNTWTDSVLDAESQFVFDTSADFLQGELFNLNTVDVINQLSLNRGGDLQTLPIIWISNSGEGTVSKFDTRTGKELGRYRTGPGGDNPSRIAVDAEGNAWVANREGNNSVIKILHSDFIDKNGNGVIDTSVDLNGDGIISADEILPWDADGDGVPDDERIQFVKFIGGGPRGVAIDANNKVWVAPWSGTEFYVFDNFTGELETIVPTSFGSYGAIIDQNGQLWSVPTVGAMQLLQIDTVSRTVVRTVPVDSAYGITVDQGGIIWTSPHPGTSVSRFDPATDELITYDVGFQSGAGITSDRDGNIWFGTHNSDRVWKMTFADDRKTLLSIEFVTVGWLPKSASIDADGYFWTVTLGSSQAYKIDTTTNQIVEGWPVATGYHPYNYSDMTGDRLQTVTQRSGTWTEIVDSSRLNAAWAGIEITADLPAETTLSLRVRTSNDRDTLSSRNWIDIAPNQPLPGIVGRFLEVETRLRSRDVGQNPTIDRISIQAAQRPTIALTQPADVLSRQPGSFLLSGQALADRPLIGGNIFSNDILFVTVNNVPVQQLDANGGFFTSVEVQPGINRYEVTAHDRYGQTGTYVTYIQGIEETTIDFSRYSDISGSFSGRYFRTSFNEQGKLLHVDLATRNDGQFVSDVPLLVGVKNVSDPSVRLVGFDGFMPDGTPYYDYSNFVAGGRLQPGQLTESPTVLFHNPNRVQFDYELVFLGKLNEAPYFTSVPRIEALAGRTYTYDADAIDPDDDPLVYSLLVAPTGMTIDASTGVITWTTVNDNIGQHDITVYTTDGRGGSAEQRYTLSVIAAPPNRPPVITSTPVTSHFGVVARGDGFADVVLDYFASGSAGIVEPFGGNINPNRVIGRVEPVDPAVAVGSPGDGPYTTRNLTTDWLALPRGSYVTLGFTDEVVVDGPGDDIFIRSTDPSDSAGERANVYVSANGTDFVFLGQVRQLGRQGLDLAEIGFTEPVVAVRIEGIDNLGWSPGFDLFSVEVFPNSVGNIGDYQYNVAAIDPDFDTLTYSLPSGKFPSGMIINSGTGAIRWSPTADQVGDHTVVVRVDDGRGGVTEQEFVICVHPDPNNNPPIIISDPTGSALGTPSLNPHFGDVSPQLITIPPDTIGKLEETVALRLSPSTIASKVDVFLLFDDTGSFSSAAQILKDQFRDVITNLKQSMPNVDFAFGVGRFEDYNHPIANPTPLDRPFILNQPIVSVATPGFDEAINAALSRTTPGCETSSFRCDLPESMLEGLYQVATGRGFDGDDDGDLLGSGPAGLVSTQLSPGSSGDVPPFASFQADPDNNVLPAVGSRGGAGFRNDALPIILVATDYGTAYQPDGIDPIRGVDGSQVPLADLTNRGRPSTPFGKGATFQATVDALNELGAVVIGLGTNADTISSPRRMFEGLSVLTGAINQSTQSIESGIVGDPIEPGDPLYFRIALGSPASIAVGIESAIKASVSDVAISIDVIAADSSISFQNKTGIVSNVRPGDLVSVNIEIDPVSTARNTDILFVRAGTTTILGSIPLSVGMSYEYPVVALDPDGDSIRYTLEESPSGMTINEITGVVQWQSPIMLPQTVTVKVNDGRGGVDTQTFTIEEPTDLPPVTPVSPQTNLATVNQTFVYDMRVGREGVASDNYRLSHAPAGMTIHPQLGVIVWTPSHGQVGSHGVVVRIADGRGGVDLQSFTVAVSSPNAAPIFTSSPPTIVGNGRTWRYPARAQDAEGDSVSFSVVSGPQGLVFDLDEQAFTWTTTAADQGTHPVVVRVTDVHGDFTDQTFTLQVDPNAPNRAPLFASQPRTNLQAGRTFVYPVEVFDPDGDRVNLQLIDAPDGMELGVDRRLTWGTSAALAGTTAEVRLRATDGLGGSTDQAFTIRLTTEISNGLPTIISQPRLAAAVNETYAYDLVGFDPDGDSLRWQLVQGPLGMSLDPQSGTLRWTPRPDQLGKHAITIEALDAFNLTATQRFEIDVNCFNRNPAILSVPPTRALVDGGYLYPVRAIDPDGDSLQFELEESPAGMTIDAQTGVIRWRPTGQHIGSHDVRIVARDPSGAAGRQSYSVVVALGTDLADPDDPNSQTFANRAPLITSTPVFTAVAGDVYRYDVVAIDPDGDLLAYSLQSDAPGMDIDPATGRISWTPSLNQAGDYTITVQATDERGAIALQSYLLSVRANQPPQIVSQPRLAAVPEAVYRYTVRATDPDNDPISYRLITGPDGMSIDSRTGAILWTPSLGTTGDFDVTVAAADNRGASDQQSFTIAVTPDTEAPRVTLASSTNLVNLGSEVTYFVQATDNVGVQQLRLFIDGEAVALGPDGRVRSTMLRPGLIDAEAVAIDRAGNEGRATLTIRVLDPSDTRVPSVSIISPEMDATLTYLTDIVGTVSVPEGQQLEYWSVEFAPTSLINVDQFGAPNPAFREIGRGTTPVESAVLATFDPTMLLNGGYIIRLTAFNTNGQGWIEAIRVGVEGNAKIGNFRLEFTDLVVPLAGIPININRVYDTLQAPFESDFGHGWTLSLGDAQIFETVPAGQSFVPGQTKVFLTTPEGRRVGFTYEEEVTGGNFLAGTTFKPIFRPDPGVYDTLEVDGQVFRGGIGGAFFGVASALNPDLTNFRTYHLTNREGVRYTYDQFNGLQSAVDRNGNTLTVTRGGIEHSSGASIQFVRDHRGRITEIIDPDGERLRYAYDARGNLVRFTNQESLNTEYRYLNNPAHYLDEAYDPLGRRVLKAVYDENGRFLHVIDAAGNIVNAQSSDLTQRSAIVRDGNGNATQLLYDDRGNVLEETDPDGNVTFREYSDPRHPDLETRIIDRRGMVTERAYDPRGNLAELVELGHRDNPLAQPVVTRFAYNDRDDVTSITNANGATTRFIYDARGNLTQIINALGASSAFTYDSKGQRTSFTDFNGNVTQLEYTEACPCGSPSRVIYADGTYETFEYNRFGQTTRQRTYEADGTLVQQQQTFYDSLGRVTRELIGGGNDPKHPATDIRKFYNGHLLEWEIIVSPESLAPNGTLLESPATPVAQRKSRITQYKYDERDNLITQIDAMGGIVQFRYDAQGNRVLLQDPVGNITTWTYDTLNRVAEERDPFYWVDFVNANSTLSIDALLARVVEQNEQPSTASLATNQGAAHVRSFAYDAEGNQSKMIDRNNRRREFSYDHAGRLLEERWYNPVDHATAPATLVETISFTFDSLGNMLTAVDSNSRYLHTYDVLNRLTSVDNNPLEDRDVPRVILTYAYDAQGNVISTSDDVGVTVASEYDSRNRLAIRRWFDADVQAGETRDVDDARVDFLYTAAGREREVRRYSDLTGTNLVGRTLRTYDLVGRSDLLTHIDAVDEVLAGYDYQYDFSGLLINETRTHQDSQYEQIISYSYDLRGQLTKALFTGQQNELFEYDINGNRTASTLGTEQRTYTTGPSNQMISDGTHNYFYDGEGNTIKRVHLGTGETRVLNYDFHNRLVSVEEWSEDTPSIPNTPTTLLSSTSNRYDTFGNRISLVDTSVDSDATSESKHFIYSDGHIWGEQVENERETAPNKLSKLYLYGGGIDWVLGIHENPSGTLQWALLDRSGTLFATTNQDSVIQTMYSYESFGNRTALLGSDQDHFGFTGREWHSSLALHFFRSRVYDASTGNFLSVDSIGFYSGDFHLYRLGYSSPCNGRDPSGNMFIEQAMLTRVPLAAIGGITALSYAITCTLLTAASAVGMPTASTGIFAACKVADCPPCPAPPTNPPPRTDTVPPSRPHWPCPGTHTHVFTYIVRQNPITCQCFNNLEEDVVCH